MARTKNESSEVPALQNSGIWSRLTSPLPLPVSIRGWMRGRIRGCQAAWREVVGSSGLPAPVQQTIALIVRRTRLWRSEQADVARELCAHFADGIAAGAKPEDLCRGFGEPKAAARLIRAAKRRGRPLWWQAWHYGLRGVGCLLGVMLATYAVLAVMFFAYTPSVKRNYSAEINARILATPEEARAWPVYLGAMKELGRVPLELESSLEKPGEKPDPNKRVDVWPQRPGDERWPAAAAWVNSKHGALEKVRRASSMAHLGFPLWDQLPEDYRKFQAERSGTPLGPAVPREENPMLVGVLLPYLGDFRQIARVLMVDARVAAQEHDADRFVADVRAICGMARQCNEAECLINQLVAVAILAVAQDVVKDALPKDLLDEAHLRDLAHMIGAFDDSVIRASLTLEKDFLYDSVQRMYSDNGSGDGHITHSGLKLLESYSTMGHAEDDPTAATLSAAVGPLNVAGMASRKELLATADRLYAMSEQEMQTPLWQWDVSPLDAELERLNGSVLTRSRYMLLTLVFPAIGKVHRSIEQSRQTRDGVLVAIALETYRRKHGAYPATLEELTPGLLPTIPPDRYDGKPLKYRRVGEGSAARPIVYSIGVDRIDDGGRGPKDSRNAPNLFSFKTRANIGVLLADPKQHDSFSGDWILYGPE
jgi:hypothetical protein